MNIADITE